MDNKFDFNKSFLPASSVLLPSEEPVGYAVNDFNTCPLYLQLELNLNDDTPKCRLNLPQAPLIPYSEPKIQDGNLLPQSMLDLLDMDVESARIISSRSRKNKKKRTFRELKVTNDENNTN